MEQPLIILFLPSTFPDRPLLLVLSGTTVSSGEDVSLLCQSWNLKDSFLLSKEGATNSPLCLRSNPKLSSTGSILHDCCDLSPKWDLQVLWVLKFIPLPVVTL
jgi:hypothetical protein